MSPYTKISFHLPFTTMLAFITCYGVGSVRRRASADFFIHLLKLFYSWRLKTAASLSWDPSSGSASVL